MALSYSEVSATTQKYMIPKLIDNIFSSNVLLARARKKGWYETYAGGEKIVAPIAYATTTANGWYSGDDTLSTTANDQITAAEFDMAMAYVNITITRQDELKNSGKEAIVDLVRSKVQLAEKTLADTLGTGLYNSGTTTDAIIGLRLAVDSAGTYGGISRTDYSWWAAKEDTSTTILSIPAMQGLYGDCTVGNAKPSVITTSQDYWDDFFGLLQPQQRFTNTDTAKAGFTSLLFQGTEVLADGHAPANTLLMLNEDYLMLKAHKDENFRFQPFQKPENQNVSTAKIFWAGALVCNNCRMQGKMSALT